MTLDVARRLAKATQAAAGKIAGDPISLIDWTKPQWTFLTCPDRRKLFRTGQQLGKSTVGLAECVLIATGRHPHQRHQPPVEIWVITQSRSQGLAVQKKLDALLPVNELAPGHKRWNPGTGFGHHEAMVLFRNGSIIRFRTVGQDAMNLASATIHHALLDEAPPEEVYAELVARTRFTGGSLSMTFTPINRDCTYLQKLSEEKRITDLHFRLTPENMIQVKSGLPLRDQLGQPIDEDWIEAVKAETLEHIRPIACDGEWDTRAVGRYFQAFARELHVRAMPKEMYAPGAKVHVALGIDHGTAQGKQAAILAYVLERKDEAPLIHVIDEYRPTGQTVPEDDARGILAMLRRQKMEWKELDFAYGDRPVGAPGTLLRKGNYDLEDHIAKNLGMRSREALSPRIISSKRGMGAGAGSVAVGTQWVNAQLIRGNLSIDPVCTNLATSFEKWAGVKEDPEKDLLDALRYAMFPWIIGNRTSHARPWIKLKF